MKSIEHLLYWLDRNEEVMDEYDERRRRLGLIRLHLRLSTEKECDRIWDEWKNNIPVKRGV